MSGNSGKEAPAAEDQVKLKPVLGIQPGVYLTLLYGVIILLILFFILLYPGLSKPGSLGIFSSEPSGAAVRIDGITLGHTPCEVFVSRGKHTLEMVLPGFNSYTEETETGGRIFASKWFPSRVPFRGTLSVSDPVAALAAEAAEYARWSLAAEPVESWQVPQNLSEGVYRTGPDLRDPGKREEAERILETSLGFASTRAAARDLTRAKFLLDNGGLSPSPLTLLKSVQDAAARLEDSPGGALWLANILSEDPSLTGSAWYKTFEAEAANRVIVDLPSRLPGSLNVEGIGFVSVPAGNLVRPGHPAVSIPSLFVALEEVSLPSWEAFIAENPRWGEDRRGELVEQGLVQDDYLRSPGFEAYPYPAAPGISWYAAEAYCAWLSEKLPPGLKEAGWKLRLPLEEEWEFAARYFEDRSPEASAPLNFMGGLWEWCANPFVPLDFFPRASLERIGSAGENRSPLERSVRGGSWINTPGSIDPGTRGSLPPKTSSPFTGFRPFIAPPPSIER
jgi:hypothetical protein